MAPRILAMIMLEDRDNAAPYMPRIGIKTNELMSAYIPTKI